MKKWHDVPIQRSAVESGAARCSARSGDVGLGKGERGKGVEGARKRVRETRYRSHQWSRQPDNQYDTMSVEDVGQL